MMTIPIIIIINIFTISVSQITSARRPYRTTISILPVLIQSSKNLVKTVDQCIRRIRATEWFVTIEGFTVHENTALASHNINRAMHSNMEGLEKACLSTWLGKFGGAQL